VSDQDTYRHELAGLAPEALADYLGTHSGLPGPRANLTLVQAAADVADAAQIQRLAASDDEYLALCGAVGLGRLLAAHEGDDAALRAQLRQFACDSRWRVREGVAMALQRVGDVGTAQLWSLADAWLAFARAAPGDAGLYVARAVVAGVAEPRLVRAAADARAAQQAVDTATGILAAVPGKERRSDAFRVLRQALAYGWSVVIPGSPESGFDALDRWAVVDDADVRWLVRQNTTKARLTRADPDRVERLRRNAGRSA